MSSEHTTPDTTEYAIEVNGLSKCYQIYDKPSDRLKQMLMRGRKQYYKEFWALKDVSFKIKKGETVGIIGRNGSGKSTLLQMICGTLNPTGGEVKVNGRVAVGGATADGQWRARVALASQKDIEVTLSYRKPRLLRIKKRNSVKIDALIASLENNQGVDELSLDAINLFRECGIPRWIPIELIKGVQSDFDQVQMEINNIELVWRIVRII